MMTSALIRLQPYSQNVVFFYEANNNNADQRGVGSFVKFSSHHFSVCLRAQIWDQLHGSSQREEQDQKSSGDLIQ